MPLDAASLMSTEVITVTPDMSINQVARLMADRRISAVPVCEADGTLVGMLSEGDLLRPMTTEAETRRAWWLRMLAEGTALAPEFLDYVRVDRRRVRDLMVTDVISVTEQTPAQDVVALLIRHWIKRVPVLRDGKVVGIVARADLVGAMAGMRDALQEAL